MVFSGSAVIYPVVQKPALNFVASNRQKIPVEFVVLHYTACGLQETLRLFSSEKDKVCAHFIIDLDGTIYDCGNFYSGPIYLGAHAGASHFTCDGVNWEAFNKFSIGIELVNYNGNLLPYPEAQFVALLQLLKHLLNRFEALRKPERIVGHEHIAAGRGKVDPGLFFNWNALYDALGFSGAKREAVLSQERLEQFFESYSSYKPEQMVELDWINLSLALEGFTKKI